MRLTLDRDDASRLDALVPIGRASFAAGVGIVGMLDDVRLEWRR